MIGLSFKNWSHSKFYQVFGGYMIAKRFYYKGHRWTPFVFLRWKSYNKGDNITWEDIKEVCTSLDNIFYGSMVFAAAGLLYWLWLLMGIWLIAAPAIYILMCFMGSYIKQYFYNKGYDKRPRKA